MFTEILNNAELYQQFVDLVNGAIDCSTILACLTTTTTTSSTTSTTSTSTTTACPNTNLLINGDFAGNLAGWSQTIGGDWIWSSSYGGSANFDQRDELGLLYQDILTPGVIYNITFTLHNTSSGDISGCWIKVFAGTTEYGPISPLGATNISIQLTAADTSRFAFQVLDTCDLLDNNFFVSNVVVSLPCTTTTTTTTTTACPYPNLIVNGDFTDDLTGWNNTAFEWSWNADHGGSAFFGGQDNISNLLFQEVLTVGQSYDITFTLFNFAPCTEFAYLNVHVGDTIYGPITYSGTTIINLTITCTGSEVFGFQGYDACGEEVGQHIFVNNVTVNQHCSNFITTTTTTTTAIPCSRWGYNYASYSCNICEFIDYGFLYNSNPLTLNNFYQYEGLTITPYEFTGCNSGNSDASIPDTGVITCEEIVCTTTTTTTIAPRVCAIYGLQATILEGSWSALDCLGEPVNGLLTSGDTTYTPCIDVSTLEMVDGEIKITINC